MHHNLSQQPVRLPPNHQKWYEMMPSPYSTICSVDPRCHETSSLAIVNKSWNFALKALSLESENSMVKSAFCINGYSISQLSDFTRNDSNAIRTQAASHRCQFLCLSFSCSFKTGWLSLVAIVVVPLESVSLHNIWCFINILLLHSLLRYLFWL